LGDPPQSFCPLVPSIESDVPTPATPTSQTSLPGTTSSPTTSPVSDSPVAFVSDAPTPTIDPPVKSPVLSPIITCPPVDGSVVADGETKNNGNSTPIRKNKKTKSKGRKDDVRKEGDGKGSDRVLRKLNVGPRPAPVAPPVLECPEPTSPDAKEKQSKVKQQQDKKKKKVQEDRHDPSEYDDDY
jgi:hypothetical protein